MAVMSFDPNLGPLRRLTGVWEGHQGSDVAPSATLQANRQKVTSKFRERMVFEPTGQVDNHEQTLFGLRYSRTAWRIGSEDPFHEEVGDWMWDPASQLVVRSFMPPRGMAILAGGHTTPDADGFSLKAEAGSETFGISSSPFLLQEFKTTMFTVDVHFQDDNTLLYEEHTFMQMKDRDELFDHVDVNTLKRA